MSTKEQNIDRQLEALKEYDIPKENIFCDYQSGKDFLRPSYISLMEKLREGDLLIVKSIDRLGRNYEEIIAQWQYITKRIKADIMVLDMALLDTRTKSGNLTGKLISDLVLQIMAYLAQAERDAIHQRQAEGIAVAKTKGVHFGRHKAEMPARFEQICHACYMRELTIRQGAKELGISHSTFYRHYVEYKKNFVLKCRHFGTNN